MKIKLKIDFLNKEPVEGNPQTNKTQVDKSKTNQIPSSKHTFKPDQIRQI